MSTIFVFRDGARGREADGGGRYTANNYNGVMARNAKLTIVEAEEIVYVTVDALRASTEILIPRAVRSAAFRRTLFTFLVYTSIV